MEKKFNYVYITSNLINGHKYIGDRSCNCNPEEDIYLGSGTYYKNAEKLYGKQNFKKEILEFFPTKQEAFNSQEKYIKQYNTLKPNGYNLSPKGGNNVRGCHSEETIEKNRQSNIGKKHTIEAKIKMSNSHKGKKQSPETIQKRIKTMGDPWNKGKPNSIEHNKNISNSLLKEKNPFFGKKHKKESCEKMSKTKKENGTACGEKNPMYGRSYFTIWIEKYGEEKAIKMKNIMYRNRNKKRKI